MQFAFIDESARDKAFYFLGALIVNRKQLEELKSGLDQLLLEYELKHPPITRNVELHGSAMMRGADPLWRKVPKGLCVQLFREALKVICAIHPLIYIEAIDIMELTSKVINIRETPREIAFKYLLERINETSKSKVQVFADEHYTSDLSISNFQRYKRIGTLSENSSTLQNIENEITFMPSDLHRALQATDLVTYLFNRVHTVKESSLKAQHAKAKLWQTLETKQGRHLVEVMHRP